MHSTVLYLDDQTFNELKSIEDKLYNNNNKKIKNRSDTFAEIIHSYFSERTTMIARINHLEDQLSAATEAN